MKDENDILLMKSIKTELNFTGIGDKLTKKKTTLVQKLSKLVEDNQNKTFDEIIDTSDNLEEGIEKIFIPYNTIDIYTRREVLLRLKLSDGTDILTEASNIMDELYKRCQIQNEQQYENALDKINTN